MSLREELLGIQTGLVEDTHGWLTRLASPQPRPGATIGP